MKDAAFGDFNGPLHDNDGWPSAGKNLFVGDRLQGRTSAYLIIARYTREIAVVRIEVSGNVEVLGGHAKAIIVPLNELEVFLAK